MAKSARFRNKRGEWTSKGTKFGEKCSLSEQKGEMNIKRGHFWTKWPNLGEIRRTSKEIEDIPQFYHEKGA
jgi:hypothetical protein